MKKPKLPWQTTHYIAGTVDLHAHSNLFTDRTTLIGPLLVDKDKAKYPSIAVQLLNLVKVVGLLVAVVYLTKRVLTPQENDYCKIRKAI